MLYIVMVSADNLQTISAFIHNDCSGFVNIETSDFLPSVHLCGLNSRN